jgi:hypothetical protein
MSHAERFVLGVDRDGVVADFYGGLRPIAAAWLGEPRESPNPGVSYNLPEWNLDRAGGYNTPGRFAVTQRDLFRTLAPTVGTPAALRWLWACDIRMRINHPPPVPQVPPRESP